MNGRLPRGLEETGTCLHMMLKPRNAPFAMIREQNWSRLTPWQRLAKLRQANLLQIAPLHRVSSKRRHLVRPFPTEPPASLRGGGAGVEQLVELGLELLLGRQDALLLELLLALSLPRV
jgi:hypothetical protein